MIFKTNKRSLVSFYFSVEICLLSEAITQVYLKWNHVRRSGCIIISNMYVYVVYMLGYLRDIV